MARGFRSLQRGRPVSQRHRPSWSIGPSGAFSVGASSSTIFATGAQAGVDELTLIRTRGVLVLHLSAVASANEGFAGAVGICNVTENAFNAGVGSIPTPITDIAWDGWLWYQFFSLKSVTATISDGSNAGAVVKEYVVDSKAMRKTNITDVIVGVLETTEAGASTLNAFLDTRTLNKVMS